MIKYEPSSSSPSSTTAGFWREEYGAMGIVNL
jgi:hypothetical protein